MEYLYPFKRFPFTKILNDGEAKGAFMRVVVLTIDYQKIVAPIGLHIIYRLYFLSAYRWFNSGKRWVVLSLDELVKLKRSGHGKQ